MNAFSNQQTLTTLRANQQLQQAIWDHSEKTRIEQHDAHVMSYNDYLISSARRRGR